MKRKVQKNNDEAILYKKITFDPKDATEDDIFAFDTAENWAESMEILAKKLQKMAIERKKKAQKTKAQPKNKK